MDYIESRVEQSSYFPRWERRSKKIINNPEFKKELNYMKKNFPIFKNRKDWESYIIQKNLNPKKTKSMSFLKSKKNQYDEPWIDDPKAKRFFVGDPDAWKNFANKWKFDLTVFLCYEKIEANPSLAVTTAINGRTGERSVRLEVFKDATEADIREIAPLLIDEKNRVFGESSITPGRPKKANLKERDKKIKAEIQERIKDGEDLKWIYHDIHRREHLSISYVRNLRWKKHI